MAVFAAQLMEGFSVHAVNLSDTGKLLMCWGCCCAPSCLSPALADWAFCSLHSSDPLPTRATLQSIAADHCTMEGGTDSNTDY